MKKVYLIIGLFLVSSGCAGIQVAQNVPDAMEFYGPRCAEVGYKEQTQPYADCILAFWKKAEREAAARRERASMFLMMMGQGMRDAGDAYSNTYNSWSSPTYTHCIPVGNAMSCTSH